MSERLVEVRFTVKEAEALITELQWITSARPITTHDRPLHSSLAKLSFALIQREDRAESCASDSSHRDDAPPLGWSDV